MHLVARLEHLSHITEIVAGYVWALAIVIWSILTIVTWYEKRRQGSIVMDGTYHWRRKLIDLFLPLVATGLAFWTLMNGISPDWIMLIVASAILTVNWEYSTQWRKMRR